jgi:drug/metabolite transporter (DMT)-like permease
LDLQPSRSEQILNLVSQDLQRLQEDVISQLTEDVAWLRSEKSTLRQEVEQLRQERQALLTENQLAQQQQWAQEFAKILARYLQQQLQQYLEQALQKHPSLPSPQSNQQSSQPGISPSNLASIPEWAENSVLSQRLQAIEQAIDRYQDAVFEQLEILETNGIEGNTRLENLVQRLHLALNASSDIASGISPVPIASPLTTRPSISQTPISQAIQNSPNHEPIVAPTPLPVAPSRPIPRREHLAAVPIPIARWNRQGIALALLSMLMLSLQYVLAQALFQFPGETNFNGTGLDLEPTWGNTALLVGLRMMVLLPLITVFSRWLQPGLGDAFADFLDRSRPQTTVAKSTLWWNLGVSGLVLFLSQWFLYRAVGSTSASLGVSLFFIYPAIVPLLAWFFNNDRPSSFRLQCMAALGVGGSLILSQPSLDGLSNSNVLAWGALSAVLFAFYLMISDRCHRHLNPTIVSLVQYAIVILLSLPALLTLPQSPLVHLTSLGLGGVLLGGTAALSYILNVFAVQIMGSLPSLILNGLTPLITSVLGVALLQTPIAAAHVLGLLLVTIGAFALNLERLRPDS